MNGLLDELQSEVAMDSKMYPFQRALRDAETCEFASEFKANIKDALEQARDIVTHLEDLMERAQKLCQNDAADASKS